MTAPMAPNIRWLVCCLLLPLSANAASVLLVPQDEKSRALAEELHEPFTAAKLTVKMAGPGSPAVSCLADKATRLACLTGIGEKAKVIAVFVVSGAMKGNKGVITLEMLAGGAVVKKESTKVFKGRVKQQMKGPIAQLLKLLPKVEPTAPTETPKVVVTQKEPEPEPDATPEPAVVEPLKVADAPKRVEPVLTPRAQQPNDELELRGPSPRASKPKVAAWVMTGLAVVAAGTAATFGGLGLAGKGRLETAPGGVSPLSYSEAQALQQSTNTQLTVALGTGIGAGVSGVVAGILWGVE